MHCGSLRFIIFHNIKKYKESGYHIIALHQIIAHFILVVICYIIYIYFFLNIILYVSSASKLTFGENITDIFCLAYHLGHLALRLWRCNKGRCIETLRGHNHHPAAGQDIFARLDDQSTKKWIIFRLNEVV